MKVNKRVFIAGNIIINRFNGYEIGGKTGNCYVYIRPAHGAKILSMVDHVKSVMRDKLSSML